MWLRVLVGTRSTCSVAPVAWTRVDWLKLGAVSELRILARRAGVRRVGVHWCCFFRALVLLRSLLACWCVAVELLPISLRYGLISLRLMQMALVRTNDAERFEPSVKVSLDGVCGSNGSGSLIAATPAPAAAVDDHAADDAADAAHDAGGAAHWGYTGAEGPLNWGSLHADWAMCASGVRQSPVNIKTVGPGGVDNAGPIDDITKKIAPTDFIDVSKMLPDNDFSDRVKAIHNGHAITCAGTQAYLTHAGSNWKLLHYHFHTPSEHSLDGTLFAAGLFPPCIAVKLPTHLETPNTS